MSDHTNYDFPTLTQLVDNNTSLNPDQGVLADCGDWLVMFTTNTVMETPYDRANEQVLNELLDGKDGCAWLTLMSRGVGYTTLLLVDPNGEAIKVATECHCAIEEHVILRDESISSCEHCGQPYATDIDDVDHHGYCSEHCEHEATTIEIICLECGFEFDKPIDDETTVFCDDECKEAFHS